VGAQIKHFKTQAQIAQLFSKI